MFEFLYSVLFRFYIADKTMSYIAKYTWNVCPRTVSCWGGGLLVDVLDFLSSAIEALLSVSIRSEDISDDDVEDVEFL